MFTALLRRFAPLAGAAVPLRTEVCPPSRVRPAAEHLLADVRAEFCLALADVGEPDARVLIQRMSHAATLRELWHLRPELFHAVALRHSQDEADRRLARLNRHFPTRAPKSGFAPLV
jgi:hypothetical protein